MQTADEQILATLPAIRPILDQISNKWSILVLTFICEKPQRFNVIKRRLDGITQKALTETLRRMERHGLLARRVIPVSPVAVEYSITPLGRTLQEPLQHCTTGPSAITQKLKRPRISLTHARLRTKPPPLPALSVQNGQFKRKRFARLFKFRNVP